MTLLFSFSANVNAIPIKLVYMTSPGTNSSFFMYCNTSSVSVILIGVALRRQSERHPHVTELGFTPLICIVLKSLIALSTLPSLPHALIAAVQAPTSLKRALPLAFDFCLSMIRNPFNARSTRRHRLHTSMRAQYVTPFGVIPSLIIRFSSAKAISGSFSPPLPLFISIGSFFASLTFVFFLATVDMSIVYVRASGSRVLSPVRLAWFVISSGTSSAAPSSPLCLQASASVLYVTTVGSVSGMPS
mmetsp:Transcript_8871/g.16251  ORF Transcript_8871/g.16251 Transcript_8871/m.16251 type:complete len:245 (-) Transcript_8871:247-981(-)